MFEQHRIFETPPGETVIWRFMDTTKFFSMLTSRSLFFCCAKKMEDPYEGLYPDSVYDRYQALLESTASKDDAKKMADVYRGTATELRNSTYVNCWHINAGESAAMWQLYAKNIEGIAIRATVKGLCDSLAGVDYPVHVGRIRYADFDPNLTGYDLSNHLSPFLLKRRSFDHERELRALFWLEEVIASRTPRPSPLGHGEFQEAFRTEREKFLSSFQGYVPVDLDLLVDFVYVAPKALPWHKDLVQDIMGKYELNKPVIQSSLYGPNLG